MQQAYVRIVFGADVDEEEEEDQAKNDKKLQAFLREQEEADRKRYAVPRPPKSTPTQSAEEGGDGAAKRRRGSGLYAAESGEGGDRSDQVIAPSPPRLMRLTSGNSFKSGSVGVAPNQGMV